jgi:fatty-acid desaturase
MQGYCLQPTIGECPCQNFALILLNSHNVWNHILAVVEVEISGLQSNFATFRLGFQVYVNLITAGRLGILSMSRFYLPHYCWSHRFSQ